MQWRMQQEANCLRCGAVDRRRSGTRCVGGTHETRADVDGFVYKHSLRWTNQVCRSMSVIAPKHLMPTKRSRLWRADLLGCSSPPYRHALRFGSERQRSDSERRSTGTYNRCPRRWASAALQHSCLVDPRTVTASTDEETPCARVDPISGVRRCSVSAE